MTQASMDMETRPLPAGWKWVKLGDVSTVITGSTPSRSKKDYFGEGIPWVTGKDILESKFIEETSEQITQTAVDEARARVFPDNTVMIVCIGATLGKIGIVEYTASCNQQINGIICGSNFNYDFAYYWFKSQRHELMGASSKSTLPILNKSQLSDWPVPLPPLAEQQRIASILNEQMASVEQARNAAEEKLEAAQALPAAYLREVFEGEEAKGWEELSVSELLSSGHLVLHKDGNHGSSYPRKNEFVDEGVKFVAARDITLSGKINFEDAVALKPERAASLRIGWGQSGDVLLAHNATVGPVAYIPEGTPAFLVGTSLTIYRCNPELMNNMFLYYSLQSHSFQSQLFNAMSQTTRNQVPISIQKRCTLSIPPLTEQSIIFSKLDQVIRDALFIQEPIRTELDTIDAMPAALLRKAFNGEL